MNESLCDRCFACAQQVIETYDIQDKYEHDIDLKNIVKKIINYINEHYNQNNPYNKINSLLGVYPFLNDTCLDCNLENKNRKSKHNIIFYLKVYLLLKIFDIIMINENINQKLLDNYNFMKTIKIKLLQIQFNKKTNYNYNFHLYLNCLEQVNMGPMIINFKELNKINSIYKKFFGLPIYLANLDKELYQEREKLKLDELIHNHPLVLNKENEECSMPYLQYYQSKYFN